jgi:hypothetical protein
MHQVISARNEFTGKKDGRPVLHDDFDQGKGKKDVYVENCGEGNIYVRIKLKETMNLTSYTWRPSEASHWITHTYTNAANCADCQNNSHLSEKFHTYFQWVMGGQKWYMPSGGASDLAQNTTVYTGSESGVKQTPNAVIITAAAYLAQSSTQQDAFIGWICDTDGYAYWSQPLEPGKATGLLLSQVNRLTALQNKNYYYAIDVIMEAVDSSDIPMLRDGAAASNGSAPAGTYPAATNPNGKAVIDSAWYRSHGTTTGPVVSGVTLSPLTASYTIGGTTLQFNATVSGTSLVSGTGNSAVNWSVSPASGASISSSGAFTATVAGTYTITVSAKDDGTKTATATVTAINSTSYPEVFSVTLSPSTAAYTIGGAAVQFNATVAGNNLANGTGNSAVVWSVSPASGAAISSSGSFTATVAGSYTITVTAKDDGTKTATATVTAGPSVEYGVAINGGNRSISIGESIDLTYTASLPAGNYYENWSTVNASVVDVESSSTGHGLVTGLAEGSTSVTLTITINGEDYSDTITVTVLPDATGLAVKTPANSTTGYVPRAGEGAQFTGYDWDLTPPYTSVLDRAGAIRLEDVLAGSSYTGVTVTSLNSLYANNQFSIGVATDKYGANFAGNSPSILYSVIPDRDLAYSAWFSDHNTVYPITTTLRLTQNGKSADIKITMEYHSVNVGFVE